MTCEYPLGKSHCPPYTDGLKRKCDGCIWHTAPRPISKRLPKILDGQLDFDGVAYKSDKSKP